MLGLCALGGFLSYRLEWADYYYIVIRYPQQMVKMAFCDLSDTFHKQVTNDVTYKLVCHVFQMNKRFGKKRNLRA